MSQSIQQRLQGALTQQNELVQTWTNYIQEKEEEADFWTKEAAAAKDTNPQKAECFTCCAKNAREEVERGQLERQALLDTTTPLQTALDELATAKEPAE